MTQPLPKRLPVWSNVRAAYAFSFAHYTQYWHIVRWWALVALPVLLLTNFLAASRIDSILCQLEEIKTGKHVETGFSLILASVPNTLFTLFLIASVAVSWHRFILLHETPAADRHFRRDAPVVQYYLYGLGLWLLAMVPAMLPDAKGPVPPDFMLVLAGVVLLLTIFTLAVRWMLILPAKAIAAPDGLGDIWRITGWSFWRILLGMLLCILPAVAVFYGLSVGCGASPFAITLSQTVQQLVHVLVTMPVSLAFLSFAYRYFSERSTGQGEV